MRHVNTLHWINSLFSLSWMHQLDGLFCLNNFNEKVQHSDSYSFYRDFWVALNCRYSLTLFLPRWHFGFSGRYLKNPTGSFLEVLTQLGEELLGRLRFPVKKFNIFASELGLMPLFQMMKFSTKNSFIG